ncbi:betaine/proline/choline family ABC transporter ATP-binding protein [Duganella sp. FT80W]|uniref:Quaternary amine transport ATP-binding protein n=1 Tax=Duganella guangzhouensis TaxID=2666084 RepID=A0A6I2L1F4_9BURK|nr:betaine/proline/choline family ABC transporter ATP-binding protein [Duganella guangzhouensis]MRW91682.1 betaine/proline/choline family ABC transporter ATP-binding protein [Duganella guangzhouensis]
MSAIKVALRNVSKVYGADTAGALARLREGAGRDALFAATGQTAALDDVSLDIPEGGICVLMGLSGSGKSTLLRTINGLVTPSAGQVLVDGEDLAAMKQKQLQRVRRGGMGMVFQSFALLDHRSVIDNVCFGLEIAGVKRAERQRRALRALEQVGLHAHAKQYPHQLSGGMRQRVGLARALAVEPSLLLMDEAFSALDPLKRREMQELLLSLQREQRRTIVFVSHDIEEALHIGDRIAILHGGRLLQYAAPRELLSNPADEHVRAFFQGVDTSRYLQAADLIDHAAEAPALATDPAQHVPAHTRLSELLPRLTDFRTPLAVHDASGATLGLITAASALRILSRNSARI